MASARARLPSFLDRLLGRRRRQPSPVQAAAPGSARESTRRELVSMALRDTLHQHGIPGGWVGAETSPALTARKQRGVHVQLVLRHWDARFVTYTVGLQQLVLARLARLDPLSREWLVGISWKLEPADDTLCPALPPAGCWDATEGARMRALPPAESPREALQRPFGQDGDAAGAGSAAPDFLPTQPMPVSGRHC